jgi:hypothetical protein
MSSRKTILLSSILTLPVLFFILHHYFNHSPELHPTGFTADENVLYMSYAHQYLDAEKFSFFYSNPFDGDPESPKIYIQPINYLFALLMKWGADPGLCFSIFGLIMAFCCILMGAKIIQHLLPNNKYQPLVITLFTWGGGLTAFGGIIASRVLTGTPPSSWIDGIYIADPANGWWGLNWGRVLFIPLEVYYHFLFLSTIYLVLKKKWRWSVVLALFLSISHPFTGIECLLILNGWLFYEKVICRNKEILYPFWICIIFVTLLHIGYYLFYLPSVPAHKQLFTQYSVGWTYSFLIIIPAYCLVFALSIFAAYMGKPIKKFLAVSHHRFFLCWAIIAFLLSKHEWFIKPMQPIHFTRGYVWAGLFLLAISGTTWAISYLQKTKLRKVILLLCIAVFLSDNLLWVTNLLKGTHTTEWEGFVLKETKDVFNYLNKNTTPQHLITSNSHIINYMSNVYTSANSWVSHPYNTPKREERINILKKFWETGIQPAEWINRKVVIIFDKRNPTIKISPPLLQNKLMENKYYIVSTP